MRKGNFILLVVVIPNIKPAVLSGQEEGADSRGGKAPVAEVAFVVFGFDEGGFEVVHPEFSTPISNRHEDFGVLVVPCY